MKKSSFGLGMHLRKPISAKGKNSYNDANLYSNTGGSGNSSTDGLSSGAHLPT